MARYIDADKIPNYVRYVTDGDGHRSIREIAFSLDIKLIPTADVVPKSEYDEVLSSWQKIHDSYDADCIEHYKYGRAEAAREILSDLKKEVHNKATYTHAKDTYSFINLNTFDQIVNEMIRRHENHGNQEA